MAIIEDDATAEADHKHKWFQDHYDKEVKRAKSVKEKSFSKMFHWHKAKEDPEASRSRVAELEELQKELKSKGKYKVSPENIWLVICKFCNWESATDSNITEDTSLSRSLHKG